MALTNTDLIALIAAIPLAALGGETFLKGVLGMASWLRLPNLLVATTLAAFATSSPELAVSTMAALTGKPEIGLGDALGSNVVNIGLILGLSFLFASQTIHLTVIRREFIFALSVPIITLMLMLDGVLSRINGVLLLAVFILWLSLKVRQAILYRRNNLEQLRQDEITPAIKPLRICLYLTVGIVCLIVSGRLFVTGASSIAENFEIHSYVIGAMVVAIGTSLPELVTMLLARWRGHDDVGLGTLLGSNLFNGMAIVGVTASIHPIHASLADVSITLLFGIVTVLFIQPHIGLSTRQRGMVLLALYIAYIATTINI